MYGEIAPYLRRVGTKNGFSRISAENRREFVTKTLPTYSECRGEHADVRVAWIICKKRISGDFLFLGAGT